MGTPEGIRVLFIAGFGPIADDMPASRKLYKQTLGLDLKGSDEYMHGHVEGTNHFALWPLSQAAMSCFGTTRWPSEYTRPQTWMELDVEDLESATNALQSSGYEILIANHTEPWGQGVTRFLGPEGMLIGLTNTPWMRGEGSE